jgi:hypothetical protein
VEVHVSYLADIGAWLAGLDRPFLFLLILPFVVGGVGLATVLVRERGKRAWQQEKE